MHAIMITFTSSIPTDQLVGPFSDYAEALRQQPGLITKTWIQDGSTLGGFHLFEDQATADAYLASDLATGLRATEGFDDFDVRGFTVLADLSAMTGVAPTATLAEHV